MPKVPSLPTSLPGGELMPHLSARMRTNIVDAVYEGIGGFERFSDWADKNPDEFYTKIWAKGVAKAVSHEVGLGDGVEALLDKLDQEERMKTIEGSFKEV
jgi:hypothetical protein